MYIFKFLNKVIKLFFKISPMEYKYHSDLIPIIYLKIYKQAVVT